MLAMMPEDLKDMDYGICTEALYLKKTENPYIPLSTEQVLSDLAESRQQVEVGRMRPLEEALDELEKRYGFA